MNVCPRCEAPIPDATWACQSCDFAPTAGEGFLSLLPEDAASDGFESSAFARLAALETGFWWFEARNDVIAWALQRWNGGRGRFLEIGCGTGFVAQGLSRRFPDLLVSCSEFFGEGLAFAAQRLPGIPMLRLDARRLPFRDAFDAIGAFDVIEHLDEDDDVLAQVRKALRPGGILVVTVPQHPVLWSKSDELARHRRRYTRGELIQKLSRAGFQVLDMRSFVSFLIPLQLIARLIPSRSEYDPLDEFRIPSFANRALRFVMHIELALLRLGLSLPFGGSLLAVARAQKS